MKKDRELLRVRIMLTAGVLALIAILALVFIKMPDNIDSKFVYEKNADGELIILGYTGDPKTLTIPSEIDGIKVAVIGARAFGSSSSTLKKVTIENGIKRIEEFAFYSCPDLTSVKLPSTLEFIGEGAFANCDYLTKISLPDSLKTIDAAAFEGCLMLSELKIPSSVNKIGSDAFLGCESLILDVSENPLAKEVAEQYSIPTDYLSSGNYYFALAIALTLAGIGIFFFMLFIFGKFINKKKQKS